MENNSQKDFFSVFGKHFEDY